MDHRQLAALACKILGLFAILNGLVFSGSLFWFSWSEDPAMLVAQALPVALYVGVGVLLVVFANPLGARLAGSTGASEPATVHVDAGFEVVAIGLLGLCDLVRSVPTLLNEIAWAATRPELELAGRYGEGLMGSALRVALGLWLLLGARGLATALRNLRRTGLQPGERPWEAGDDPVP